MYAVLDDAKTPQLMDVYLAGSPSNVTAWSNANFDRHYNGNRQPFGIYVHPSKYFVFIYVYISSHSYYSSFDKFSWPYRCQPSKECCCRFHSIPSIQTRCLVC